jgi:glycosyltransferase involved in cell wall biosynthesis
MKRLKILFVTNWYPTKEEPVKAVWVREHAKAVRIYDDVAVLHGAGPDSNLKKLSRVESETDESLCEDIPTYRAWHRPLSIPKTSYFLYVWSILRAFRHIVNHGFLPDVIHVHVYDAGAPAILISKLNRIPVVVTEQFSSFPRRLLGRLDLLKAWMAFRWANRVLPVSNYLQKAIESYGIRAKFQVVPNVADTTLFSPDLQIPKNLDLKRILFVGQLIPVKGIPFLLQAVSELRQKRDDWRLDIIGDGLERKEYENLAKELDLCDKVNFHGTKNRHEVAKFMREADLFVLSSLSENCSTATAEALATGTPVLVTLSGGTEEFVTKDVGLSVPAADAGALCKGLDYMLNHLHLYPSLAISQYAKERFSPEVVGAKLHEVYQTLI